MDLFSKYPSIRVRIKQIRNDQVHGSRSLAIEAINILQFYNKISKAHTSQEYLTDLKQIGERLSNVRPNMVAISNVVNILLLHIKQISGKVSTFDKLKELFHYEVILLQKRMNEDLMRMKKIVQEQLRVKRLRFPQKQCHRKQQTVLSRVQKQQSRMLRSYV